GRAAEAGPLPACVIVHERAHLIDGPDAVLIAVALRVAPREQPVTAEHDALAPGMIGDRRLQHHGELEPGTLPRHPDDAAAEAAVEIPPLSPAGPAPRAGGRPARVPTDDPL